MTGIVGLSGRAGSGKSTAADVLVDAGWSRVKFAAALKDMMRALYRAAGLDDAEIERRIEGDLKETPCPLLCGKTPRHAMQTLGTDWGRNMIGPDLWIGLARSRIEGHMLDGRSVVADDVRFENEAATIRDLGGLVVQIKRETGASVGDHVSEAGVDANIEYCNDGSADQLRGFMCYVFLTD